MKRWISLFLAAVLLFTCIPLDIQATEIESDALVSLTVTDLPDKMNYMPGEAPDLNGLAVEARYSSGNAKMLTAADMQVAPETLESGEQTVTVSWDGQDASFDVHVHTLRTLEAVAPTYTQPGLTEGKDCKVCGMILQEQEAVSVKTAPKLTKPVVKLLVSANGVGISWNAVENAEFYQVYRKTAGGKWVLLDTVSGTSYTDDDADSGIRVYYSVRACVQTADGLVRSDKSSNKSVFFVAATMSNTSAGVAIEWLAVEQASFYRVYRRVPGGSWKILRSKTTGTNFVDTTAEGGVTYQYAVRAYDGSAISNYNYDLEFTRLQQTAAAASNKTAGIRVSWNRIKGAEEYEVYRKVSGGSWQRLDTVEGLFFLDENADSGVTYSYMIRARRGNSVSSAKTVTILRLSRPKPTVSNAYTGVSVKWDAVEGASSYRVYRRLPGGSWDTVATGIKATQYTDTTAKSGTVYQYTVRAYGSGVLSGYTTTKSIEHLSRPKLTAKSASPTSVKLSWKAVTGAEEYLIYVRTGDSDWQELCTVTGTDYTVTDLTTGSSYSFSMRAVCEKNRSARSASSTAKAIYPVPDYEVELEPSEGIRITWSAVEGAGSYQVYRRTIGGSWKTLKTTTKTSYTDDSGKPGTTYEYAVRAFELANAGGIYSARATGKTIVFSMIDPDKPMVALTFDDGPSKYTAEILDQLEKYGAHATFFVVGNRVASYPKTIKRAYELGCEIGNHSWSHPSLSSISVSEMKRELSKTDDAVEKVLGFAPDLLRPPYGAVDSDVKKYAGKPLIHWSIDTRDWEHRTKSKTVNSVLNNVRDGSIVLMHDIYEATADAAVTLIPTLIKKGYQLVTVSELAAYRGVNLKDGTIYYSIRP